MYLIIEFKSMNNVNKICKYVINNEIWSDLKIILLLLF